MFSLVLLELGRYWMICLLAVQVGMSGKVVWDPAWCNFLYRIDVFNDVTTAFWHVIYCLCASSSEFVS